MRMIPSTPVLVVLATCLLTGPVGIAGADDDPKAAKVERLLSRNLPDIPGKEAVMLTVEYPPGGASPPHRHDAHVFVYVLEGRFATQVAGQERVVLEAGQTYYEKPQDEHIVSANASDTERLKILVFMVKDEKAPQ